MDIDFGNDYFEEIFLSNEELKRYIDDGDFASALSLVNKILSEEEDYRSSLMKNISDLLNNSSDGDIYEINEVEKIYNLISVQSEKIDVLKVLKSDIELILHNEGKVF